MKCGGALCFVKRGSSMFSKAEEQTRVKAMCNWSGQASLAAAPIEVLSGLKKLAFKNILYMLRH